MRSPTAFSAGSPGQGFNPCLVSVSSTVPDPDETATSPRARAAVGPLIGTIYHSTLAREPEGRQISWLSQTRANRDSDHDHPTGLWTTGIRARRSSIA
jgi:hypothetical protein